MSIPPTEQTWFLLYPKRDINILFASMATHTFDIQSPYKLEINVQGYNVERSLGNVNLEKVLQNTKERLLNIF